MTVVTTDQIGRIRDSSGRRAQENTPSSTSPKNTVEYEFDTTELLFKKTTTGDNGVKSITWYDALGREKIVKSELGATTTFAYDLVGNLVSKAYKPVANDTIPETKTTYEYDRLNRPVATHLNTVVNSTNRLQKSTLTEYNAGSNFFFTKITERLFDKNNQSVDSVFVNFQDRSGSTIATVTPAAAISNSGSNGQDDGLLRPTVTLHSYSVVHTSPGDAASPAMLQETVLETIANSTGSFTTILTAIDNWPARSIKNFLYSPSGNLLSEQTLSIQNAGQLTTTDHEYDGFNRLVKVINNDFSWTEYTYDDSDNGSATGKVATIRYSNGNSTEVEYDSFGNTIKQVNKIHDRTVSEKKFTYDEKGRPLTEVVVLSNVATLEMLDTITSERHWQYTGTGSTYTARDGAEIVTTFDTAQGLRTETYTVGDEKHSRIYQINADGSIRTAQRKIESTTSPSSITSDSTVTRHYDAFGEVINEVTSATVAGKTIPVIETKYETIVSQGTITQQVSEFLGGSLIATQTRYLDGKKQIYSIDDDVLDSSTSRWTSGATGNDKSFGFRYATDGNLLSIQRKEMFGNTEIVRPTTLYAYNQGHITSITQVDNANSPISSFTQSLNVNGITQSQAKNIVGGLLPSEQIHTSTEYVYTGKLIKEIKYDRNTTDNVGPTTLDLADGSNRPENHYDYRRYYQTYANRGDFRESGSVRHSYDLAGNVDTAEIEITWNESKTIASFSDLPGLPKASDVSSPKINPIAFSWDPKLSLLETAGAADPSLSSLSLQNDWDIYNEDSLMKWSEFGELWELSRIERLKLNATEVIKQRTIVQRSYDAFGRVIQQTETIEDLKTNTELHNVQYAFGYNGNAMSLQLIAPDPASTNDYKIFRRFVYGPSGVLAVDQASLPSSASSTSSGRTDTAWYLYDLYGESLTIGMADDSNSSNLEYRHFLFGERGDISIALGSTDARIDLAPIFWKGLRYDAVANAYDAGSTMVERGTGRYLSQRGGINSPYDFNEEPGIGPQSFWEKYGVRLLAPLQMISGIVEMGTAAYVCATTGGIGCAFMIPVALHGLDDFMAGYQSYESNTFVDTYFQTAIKETVNPYFQNEETSQRVAMVADIAVGILIGGFDDAVRATYKGSANAASHAAKSMAVSGMGAVGVGGSAFVMSGGDIDSALFAANFGQMAGGLVARGTVKCFIGETLVYIPVEPIPEGSLVYVEGSNFIFPNLAELQQQRYDALAWRIVVATGCILMGSAVFYTQKNEEDGQALKEGKTHIRFIDRLFAENTDSDGLDEIVSELFQTRRLALEL